MAEDLRLYSDFLQNAKTQMLRRRLGADAVVALLQLWCAAADGYPDGDLTGKTDEFLEVAAGWMGEPGALTRTLRELRFLDGLAGSSRLHNWAERQPYVAARSERVEKASKAARSRWNKAADDKTRAERLATARQKGEHTEAEWTALVAVCGHRCVMCRTTGQLVKDHIVPIYQGGSDAISNLQPLCRGCNSAKGADSTDHRPADWRGRLLNACSTPARCLPPPSHPPEKSKSTDALPPELQRYSTDELAVIVNACTARKEPAPAAILAEIERRKAAGSNIVTMAERRVQ